MEQVIDTSTELKRDKVLSLDELVELTKGFITLANELYAAGKISLEEYEELTYIKKDFLKKADEEKQQQLKHYL